LKKVLIITYYWPPAGGSGVQRWLKFSHFLRDYGWEPVVITPSNADVVIEDKSLLEEVADDMEVIQIPIWEPYGIFRKGAGKVKHPALILDNKKKSLWQRLAIWIRANVLIPDPRIFWKRSVLKALAPRLEKGEFSAVISTGPPHSMHLIALEIKKKYGIHWLADFRDPWTEWELWHVLGISRWAMKIHRKMELRVLNAADVPVTISPTFQSDFEKICGKKVHLVTNGYDKADFPEDFHQHSSADKFTIIYTGIIDSIRNPMPFLEAMENFIASDMNRKSQCEIFFIGQVNRQYVDYVKQSEILNDITVFPGYIPHKEVFTYYSKAHILLLILTLSKNSQGNIPGKIFEYGATGRSILGIGNPEGDSAKIIQTEKAGQVFWPEDKEEIKLFIEQHFTRFQQGKMNTFSEVFTGYERKSLTGEIARLLEPGAQ
jgi:glycosyltransferase involved in cell wall biosynthesis